jgi:retinol dehydrogenase-12
MKKIVFITGSTDGIGKKMAEIIAQKGYTVVLHGRNQQKAEQVAKEMQISTGNPNIHYLIADFGSLAEIRTMTDAFQARFDHLDVLINNAGSIFDQREETVDGIERTFMVNYLASFLLTTQLFDALKKRGDSRVINVSAGSQAMGNLKFEDLQFTNRKYRGRLALAQSKLANVAFAFEINRRWNQYGIYANATDPLGAATPTTTSIKIPWFFKLLTPFFTTTLDKAAQSTVYAATAPHLTKTGGKFFSWKCKEKKANSQAYKPEITGKLWQMSEELLTIHH